MRTMLHAGTTALPALSTSPSSMPRFAANLSMLFTERPFLERFGAAARAGFEAVEFQFPYEHPAAEIAARLREHGLQAVLHNLPPGDWASGERGIACLPGREDEFRRSLPQAIAYAHALGVPRLNCLAGLAPAGVAANTLHACLRENLRHAAHLLRAEGLTLLVEPINTWDMPGFFLNRSAAALALIDEIGADNLQLQFDCYHMHRMEGGVAHTLARELPRIGHVQVADHPGRHEPGSGEIGYEALFEHLDHIGYAGWVGCEYRPREGTESGLGWLAGRLT